jgi:hypothetical protein
VYKQRTFQQRSQQLVGDEVRDWVGIQYQGGRLRDCVSAYVGGPTVHFGITFGDRCEADCRYRWKEKGTYEATPAVSKIVWLCFLSHK